MHQQHVKSEKSFIYSQLALPISSTLILDLTKDKCKLTTPTRVKESPADRNPCSSPNPFHFFASQGLHDFYIIAVFSVPHTHSASFLNNPYYLLERHTFPFSSIVENIHIIRP